MPPILGRPADGSVKSKRPMSRKNWFTVRVKKANDTEDDTPYEPFDGHTLTISPDGTLWMAGENARVLSVTADGYAGFEFKRLEGANPGDRLQVPLERKQLPFPSGRLRGSSLSHK
jgi:hypothetical protein